MLTFQLTTLRLESNIFFSISSSGNDLNQFNNSLYDLDKKLTFHFFASLNLSVFLSPFHSFWRPEKISGTIGAMVRYFFHPCAHASEMYCELFISEVKSDLVYGIQGTYQPERENANKARLGKQKHARKNKPLT